MTTLQILPEPGPLRRWAVWKNRPRSVTKSTGVDSRGHRLPKRLKTLRLRRSATWSLSPEDSEAAQGQHIDGLPLPPDAQRESLATVREEEDELRKPPTPTFRLRRGRPGKQEKVGEKEREERTKREEEDEVREVGGG